MRIGVNASEDSAEADVPVSGRSASWTGGGRSAGASGSSAGISNGSSSEGGADSGGASEASGPGSSASGSSGSPGGTRGASEPGGGAGSSGTGSSRGGSSGAGGSGGGGGGGGGVHIGARPVWMTTWVPLAHTTTCGPGWMSTYAFGVSTWVPEGFTSTWEAPVSGSASDETARAAGAARSTKADTGPDVIASAPAARQTRAETRRRVVEVRFLGRWFRCDAGGEERVGDSSCCVLFTR
ncbi:hypothetical protein [Nocardiopsis alba]|uniref:hypothetical protein n=1 Tax=Nocardiopsis alba TaxID=53437 RepID=UPI0006874470|nr:hypothetical protein [Nocardiopsis alba]